MIRTIVLAVGALIAFWNGANDVSKGIATLVGSGVSDERRARRWGALWTCAGGLAAAVLAAAMVRTFGTGLLTPGTTPTLAAALATLLGAAAWVLLATRSGLPVSTTHAIVGALAGVGALAYGVPAVAWRALAAKVALPLLLSPLAALLLTSALLRLARALYPVGAADCICADAIALAPVSAAGATTASASARLQIRVGSVADCPTVKPAGLRLTLHHLHWLSSAATSFARGLNDAPKMVALVLAAGALGGRPGDLAALAFGLVAGAMLAGSLAAGRRVTHVLAERMVLMDERTGLGANLVTSTLVIAGAMLGLPMSTTHVSSAAILGAGTHRGAGAVRWKVVRDIGLAWIVTLPAAALLGVLAYAVLNLVRL